MKKKCIGCLLRNKKDTSVCDDCSENRDRGFLFGVNKLCGECINKCKQWKQITIIKCPKYIRVKVK